MGDLFHDEVPDAYLRSVFDVMTRCPHHQFMVLTKRAGHKVRFARELPMPRDAMAAEHLGRRQCRVVGTGCGGLTI